jgi:2-dehydropantoate 2-reductase
MARIAIVGAGAIGGVVASLLQATGRHELVLCVRRPIRQVIVESRDGEVRIDAAILTQPEEAKPVDWVIVTTKAYDVASAALWLDPLCATGAPVAVLQNGVEHKERFSPYIAKEHIVPVIVDCPVERKPSQDGLDRIVQRGAMSLKSPEGSLGSGFTELFAGSSSDAVTVEDWTTVAWRKLCHNVVGALPALLLQPAGVLHSDALGAVAIDMVRECIAVGRAEGAQLADSVADDVIAAYRRSAPDAVNSLHADRLAGRPMEIDARNGVVVRLGKKHGIPTPSNRMAVALLDAMTHRQT